MPTHAEASRLRHKIANTFMMDTTLTMRNLVEMFASEGASYATVRRALIDRGFRAPRDNHWVQASSFKILGMAFDPERTLKSIAKEVGVSSSRVAQIVSNAKKNGIPVPHRARGRKS